MKRKRTRRRGGKAHTTRTPAMSDNSRSIQEALNSSSLRCNFSIILSGDFKRDFIVSIGLRSYFNENSVFNTLNFVSTSILIVQTPIFLHDEKRPMRVEVQLRTIAMDFWASLEHRWLSDGTLSDNRTLCNIITVQPVPRLKENKITQTTERPSGNCKYERELKS